MRRRLVYLGTPGLAVPPLEALHQAGHEIVLVVTRRDKKRGRGGDLSPSPVKAAALKLDLPISHYPSDILTSGAELGVVVAFGQIISREILDIVPMVNLHFSLLPRWRGAAPVERALLAGDKTTGVCIMGLEESLDTGPVFACMKAPIAPDATLETLRNQLVTLGTELMVSTLASELPEPTPQSGEATYAAKITANDLELDFNKSARALERIVRLGRAWTIFRDKRFGVWRAKVVPSQNLAPGQLSADGIVGTVDGGLKLLEVQPESKKRMDVTAWLNGAQIIAGETLG